MGGVVKLTVHKNKLEQRRKKELKQLLKDAAREIPIDYDSFVLVAFKRNSDSFDHYVTYHLDYPELTALLPEMVKHYILRALMEDDLIVEEDNG